MRKVPVIAFSTIFALGSFYLVSIGTAKPIAPALKISVLVTDSGSLSFAGSIQRAAARLAVTDIEESGSPVKVNLSFFDTGDTNEERQRAVAKIAATDTDLVIAPIESESAAALMTPAPKIPIIAPMSLMDDLGDDSSKAWLFRLSSSPSQESFALGQFIGNAKPKNVLIVSGSQAVNRSQQKSVAFSLAMQGIRVQTMNIRDTKAIAKTKPDALLLLSMEESIPFFTSLSDWVEQVPQVYLVPGNAADYSLYPWAKSLAGASSIAPRVQISTSFRADLTKALGYSNLSGSRGTLVLNLGQRVYEAIRLAAASYSIAKADTAEGLRAALAGTVKDGKALFDRSGFSKQIEYSVYKYGSSGTFALKSTFSPN